MYYIVSFIWNVETKHSHSHRIPPFLMFTEEKANLYAILKKNQYC